MTNDPTYIFMKKCSIARCSSIHHTSNAIPILFVFTASLQAIQQMIYLFILITFNLQLFSFQVDISNLTAPQTEFSRTTYTIRNRNFKINFWNRFEISRQSYYRYIREYLLKPVFVISIYDR